MSTFQLYEPALRVSDNVNVCTANLLPGPALPSARTPFPWVTFVPSAKLPVPADAMQSNPTIHGAETVDFVNHRRRGGTSMVA